MQPSGKTADFLIKSKGKLRITGFSPHLRRFASGVRSRIVDEGRAGQYRTQLDA